jgi:hypothetical protein
MNGRRRIVTRATVALASHVRYGHGGGQRAPYDVLLIARNGSTRVFQPHS